MKIAGIYEGTIDDTNMGRAKELRTAELFEMVGSGKVAIAVKQRFPLAEAADAHGALEARQTSGSTVLTV